MTPRMQALGPQIMRRVIRLQVLTVAWMIVEAGVSLSTAWLARSPALLGFGGDSAIELVSAVIVLHRFRSPHQKRDELVVAKIAGGLLFLLAAFVILASTLSLLGHVDPQPTILGIALLLVAAVAMPLLAQQKRKLSTTIGSAVLRADATESAVCGYLAWIALAGLAVNAAWKVRWADPVAALGLLPLIVHEGWETLQGKPCRDS